MSKIRAALAFAAALVMGAMPADAEFSIQSTIPQSVYDAVRTNPMLADRAIQRFSDDGSFLIGAFDLGSDEEAFVWSEAGGIVLLGDLPGGRYDATPTGISADGTTIVGRSWGGTADDAFVWDAVNGMQPLGAPPTGYSRAVPLALSDDATTIAGYLVKTTGPPEAFRFEFGVGYEPLGKLPGGSQSWATAVSADGQAVAGYSLVSGGREAFLWTPAAGLTPLGDLPGSLYWSQGTLISDAGDAVVGHGWVQDNCDGACSYPAQRAFRWTASEGMLDLDSFTSYLPYSVPISTSSDATVVVGEASDDRHFLWREGLGNEQLEPLFADESGTDVAEWEIAPLQIVEDDGVFAILGVGQHLAEDPVIWRIRLVPPAACENGVDDDGDGLIDHPDDPGCRIPEAVFEDPACDDGEDNDGDGGIDWDGAGVGPADLDCNVGWRARELPNSCGIGAELALLLVPLFALRGWRGRRLDGSH